MELKELKYKTILITGSAKRIAKEIVLDLSKYYPRFLLHYRSSEKEANQLLEKVRKYNGNSKIIKANFTITKERENFFNIIKEENIDIVINSASLFPTYDNWENFNYENFQKIFDVNFFTPANIIKCVFNNNKKGLVINFLDASLDYNYLDHFIYRISKYALEKLTYMLALELAPNVRVNAISPGAILPPAQINKDGIIEEKNNIKEVYEFYEKSLKKIPLKLNGDTKYIVHAVKFLIENDFITGVNLKVDGGEYI